ncbi:MAG: hypothetical protein M3133_10010 [Actinomycetota bacterium]|nr:hypothetical protein [Actinomycetota bacterium]
MATLTKRESVVFDELTKNLHWRLDDSGGGPPPPAQPDFYKGGGGGAWPLWATHVMAFLAGGLTWGALLLAPLALPVVALAGLILFVAVAVRRRWH